LDTQTELDRFVTEALTAAALAICLTMPVARPTARRVPLMPRCTPSTLSFGTSEERVVCAQPTRAACDVLDGVICALNSLLDGMAIR